MTVDDQCSATAVPPSIHHTIERPGQRPTRVFSEAQNGQGRERKGLLSLVKAG